MFGLQMLDVVIGIVFIYLLLSLVCSTFGEMIATVLKCRARCLRRSLREIFDDKKGTGLTKELYEHRLIFGFFKGKYSRWRVRNLPSYIPTRDFALALMDIVLPGHGTVNATAEPCKTNEAVPPPAGKPLLLNSLQLAARAIQNPQVRQALIPLVDAAGDDVSKARENIEKWYDSVMERVTGQYKRHIQVVLLIVAFIVTIVVNVDTLAVIEYLSRNATVRNAIVTQAQAHVKRYTPSQETAKTRQATIRDNNDTALQDSNDTKMLVETLSSVRELGLPIGWSAKPFKWKPLKFSNYWEQGSPHLVGWVITAIALSMGSSFWFDFLKKLIAIRSTIKPGEKEPNDESAEKKP